MNKADLLRALAPFPPDAEMCLLDAQHYELVPVIAFGSRAGVKDVVLFSECTKLTTNHEFTRLSTVQEPWVPWQLAFDEATYGQNAGKWIVVTADGEHERIGQPMSEEEATAHCDVHNFPEGADDES